MLALEGLGNFLRRRIGHEPENVGDFWKLEKPSKASSKTSRYECSSANTFISGEEICPGLLNYRTSR